MTPRKENTDVHQLSERELLVRIDERQRAQTDRLDKLPCGEHLEQLTRLEKGLQNGKVYRAKVEQTWSVLKFFLPLLLGGGGATALWALLGGK
jgi:hypothetical protein